MSKIICMYCKKKKKTNDKNMYQVFISRLDFECAFILKLFCDPLTERSPSHRRFCNILHTTQVFCYFCGLPSVLFSYAHF